MSVPTIVWVILAILILFTISVFYGYCSFVVGGEDGWCWIKAPFYMLGWL